MHHFTKMAWLCLLCFGLSFSINAQYCIPSTDCSYGDGIITFVVDDFTNSSGCEADSVSGYANFTGLTGLELPQGATANIQLLSGYSDQQVSIWIDTDNSMSFESDELVLTNLVVEETMVNTQITGPNVALGDYRLRVQANWNATSSDDACSMGSYGETEDYMVSIVAPPVCMTPSGSSVTVTTNGAIVSWSENGTSTNWDFEIVESGNTPTGMPTSGYDNISTNPITISDLNPTTDYSIYIRADCSTNSTYVSDWSNPMSFTTNCALFETPYYESFDFSATSNAIPDCWTEFNAGDLSTGPNTEGSGNWAEDGFANVGTEGAMRINLYQGNTVSDWLVTGNYELTGSGSTQAEFDFSITQYNNSNATNLGSDDEVHFLISTDFGATWTSLQTWTAADNVNPLGEKMIYDLSSFAGSTASFAFFGTDGMVDDSEDNDIHIDNFYVREPPSCNDVSAVNASTITDSSAAINWEENGSATMWDIEFGEAGFTPTGVPTTGYNNVSNPVTISGLAATTAYDVYVRADCSGDDSDVSNWLASPSFTTNCAVFEAPYYESFDFLATSISIADCWTEFNDGDLSTGPNTEGSGNWTEDGFANAGTEGAMRINLYQGNVISDWLVTGSYDLTGSEPLQVEFDFSITQYANSNATNLGSDDEVHFLVSTDLGTTWTSLQSWNSTSTVNPIGEKMIYNLSSFAGSIASFAFYGTDGMIDDPEDNDIHIDNFHVRQPPSCPEVSAASASNITGSSADINWEENGSATMWDIEFGEAGFTPTGVPTVGYNNVSNPITITDLTAVTAYDVYVRADCSGDDSDASIWIPLSLTTDCSVYMAPYTQDFEGLQSDWECWKEANSGEAPTPPSGFENGDWVSDDFGNSGSSNAARINIYSSNSVTDWLISPSIDISDGALYQVEFDFAITDYADTFAINLGSDDQVMFLVSSDNMMTWDILQTWTASDNVDPAGEHLTFDLNAYTGMENLTFAFYGTDGTENDPEDADIFVDNFQVVLNTAVPPAATATSSDVTCNGASDGSVDLTVTGNPGFTFAWSNGETTEDLSGIPAGTYTCEITDVNGLTTTVDATITEPEAIVADGVVVDETFIGDNDGSINLTTTGGTAPYTYSWSNGTATEDLTGLAPGEYCVTVTDSNGCTMENCSDVMAGLVSTKDISDLTNFQLSPNPVGGDLLWLNLQFAAAKDLKITLVNALGQETALLTVMGSTGLNEAIEVGDLSAGYYLLKVESVGDQQLMVRSFVKQ